ncbi:DNA-3-methyladenine glycosylase 2 family protein [Pseudonocardiaceae bacterium YIM PH 21723]|nr:DNA-3-methyladenine glycosylase 2 family protein [Pseudonocardiaceae bacterium YIM PH 21723]
MDVERFYRISSARDARYDGCFVMAVRTTGIYCRPSCPAITPKRRNVEFFPTAAGAQTAGYRACRRCMPDAIPGSPDWDLRADLAGRAMRLITDGVVEREGVSGLARQLGYSERHLTRVLTSELGAGPLALARAHRSHSARLLIETTDLSFADIAFASGFASVRQFNDTIRAVFGTTPSVLRTDSRRQRTCPTRAPGTINLKLPFRPPLDTRSLMDCLRCRAISGVESVDGDTYTRTLRLPHGFAVAKLTIRESYVDTTLRLTDLRDLSTAVCRVRRLLDLDADPEAISEVLGRDPALRTLVQAQPGIRVAGSAECSEQVLRAVIGETEDYRPLLAQLAGLGGQLDICDGGPDRLFPTPATIAERGASVLTGPAPVVDTVLRVATAMADGSLVVNYGRDSRELRAELLAIPGVSEWSADYVLMRVLGQTDVLMAGDQDLRTAARSLGIAGDLEQYGRAWRPWRSYASTYLWQVHDAALALRTA